MAPTFNLAALLEDTPSTDHDRIVRMDALVSFMAREMFGDGKPGLIEQVQSLHRFKWVLVGAGLAIGSGATILGTVAAWAK